MSCSLNETVSKSGRKCTLSSPADQLLHLQTSGYCTPSFGAPVVTFADLHDHGIQKDKIGKFFCLWFIALYYNGLNLSSCRFGSWWLCQLTSPLSKDETQANLKTKEFTIRTTTSPPTHFSRMIHIVLYEN